MTQPATATPVTPVTPVNMPAPNGDARLKCGKCKWFFQGYEGKTCQFHRKVVPETRACIEFQDYRTTPFEIIEKDKYMIEMRKTIRVWSEDAIKKFETEIKGMKITSGEAIHKDPMKYLDEVELAALGHKLEQCQAHIERLMEIRFDIMDKLTELNVFAKDTQAYLLSNYRDHVQSLKNESERGAFFRFVAPELFKAIDRMDTLKDKADLCYQNLKDGHFNIAKKLEAVIELWNARIQNIAVGNRGSRTSG